MRVISFEEANQIPRIWDDMDIKNMDIFKAVEENSSCDLLLDTNCGPVAIDILVRDESLGGNTIGFIIIPRKNEIDIYVAVCYDSDIRAEAIVCSGLDISSSLSSCIIKAKSSINKCPICGKEVPFKEQHRFSFAGRCCKECLPEMRAKYEQPGWYN